jgi:DNA-directed RNA polymerase subunit E'/Rpb7
MAASDENENLWAWNQEGQGEYYFENGDPVRVRVEAELWQDQMPTGPRKDVAANGTQERRMPYSITVSHHCRGRTTSDATARLPWLKEDLGRFIGGSPET